MKNFKLILSAVAATLLFGCADLAVEETEALSENFPAGFSYQEYVSIHPQLRYVQIKADVEKHNEAVEAVIRNLANRRNYVSKSLPASIKKQEDICADDTKPAKQAEACAKVEAMNQELLEKQDTIKIIESSKIVKAYMADTARLYGDSAMLYSMFVNPYVGGIAGYTEEDWAKNWKRTDTTITVDTVYRVDTLRLGVITMNPDSTFDTTKVFLNTNPEAAKGKITYGTKDEKTVIVKVEGFSDSGTYEVPLTFSEPEGLSFAKGKGPKVTSTDVVVIGLDTTKAFSTSEGLALDKRAYIAGFNYYDEFDADSNVVVLDDTLMLAKAALDTFAIRYQYVLFGKLHGWPYRYCTEKDDLSAENRGCADSDEYAVCDLMVDEDAKKACYSRVKCDMYPTNDYYCMDKETKISYKVK